MTDTADILRRCAVVIDSTADIARTINRHHDEVDQLRALAAEARAEAERIDPWCRPSLMRGNHTFVLFDTAEEAVRTCREEPSVCEQVEMGTRGHRQSQRVDRLHRKPAESDADFAARCVEYFAPAQAEVKP